MDSGVAYKAYIVTAFKTVPANIHGLNLPHRVLVFATIIPIIGSLNASNILAAIIIVPINTLLIPSTTL